jgi:hypothetical protein
MNRHDRELLDKQINLAQRGVRDPDVLRTMTLKELSKSEPIPFSCPSCEAKYKIVTINTCDVQHGKISCLRCGCPFPASEGNVSLKYFLVRRPSGRNRKWAPSELGQAGLSMKQRGGGHVLKRRPPEI